MNFMQTLFSFFFQPFDCKSGEVTTFFYPNTQIRFKQWNYKNNKENAVLVTATSRNNLREFCFLFRHLFTMKTLTISCSKNTYLMIIAILLLCVEVVVV